MPILTSIGASSAKAFGFTSGGGNFIVATGGTVTDYNGFRIHRFTSSNDFVITSAPDGATFELFVIGGGGGGGLGSSSGPGGGAGGAYDNTAYPCPAAGTYPVVIGAGGAGATISVGDGTQGGVSSVFGLTLAGGGTQNNNLGWTISGGDQGTWGSNRTLADGGCGAGVANGNELTSHPRWGDTTDQGRTVYDSTGGFSGSNQTYYYGFASGIGESSAGGGGGGIGGVGANGFTGAVPFNGGNGGPGRSYNWVGVTEWMGGGGGGGTTTSTAPATAGTGGSGVGGNGATSDGGNGGNAVANTGSGGGGSGSPATPPSTDVGGNGSAGLVIIKYAIA